MWLMDVQIEKNINFYVKQAETHLADSNADKNKYPAINPPLQFLFRLF